MADENDSSKSEIGKKDKVKDADGGFSGERISSADGDVRRRRNGPSQPGKAAAVSTGEYAQAYRQWMWQYQLWTQAQASLSCTFPMNYFPMATSYVAPGTVNRTVGRTVGPVPAAQTPENDYYQDGIKFYISANRCILSPGDQNGTLGHKYFAQGVQRKPHSKSMPGFRCRLCLREHLSASSRRRHMARHHFGNGLQSLKQSGTAEYAGQVERIRNLTSHAAREAFHWPADVALQHVRKRANGIPAYVVEGIVRGISMALPSIISLHDEYVRKDHEEEETSSLHVNEMVVIDEIPDTGTEVARNKRKSKTKTEVARKKPKSKTKNEVFVTDETPNTDGCVGGEEEKEKGVSSDLKMSSLLGCPRPSNNDYESAADAKGERTDWALQFRKLTQGIDTAFIDSHCHLDLLFSRSAHAGSFKEFRETNAATFPRNFAGCVTVFCDPAFWSSYESKDNLFKRLLREDNVWAAVGCHPKKVRDYNKEAEKSMNRLLKHERVKAVGEIGLDFSGSNHLYRALQIEVLSRQVETAVMIKKPIIIHARDAEKEIKEVLSKIVPRDYKIHRHCFLGSWNEAEAWLEMFPRSYIGITPAVTIFKNRTALRQMLYHLPLDKILIETDAPYFVPYKLFNHELKISNPGVAITVALEIADVKKVPIEDVLRIILKNTKDMYDL